MSLSVFAFIATFALLTGCSVDGTPAETASGPSVERPGEVVTSGAEYAPDELFLGLVLGQGAVAEEIGVIHEHFLIDNYVPEKSLETLKRFNLKIVQQIEEMEPEYLPGFKEAVQSGDRPAIQRALSDASLLAVEATTQLKEVKEFRAQLEKDPGLIEEILENARANGIEEQTVEEAEQTLLAFVEGKLGSIRTVEPIPQVGASWLKDPSFAGIAVVIPVEVAAAVCTWVTVTFDDDDELEFLFPQFSEDKLGLMQEKAIDQIATRFAI